jgi:hypothetical protein
MVTMEPLKGLELVLIFGLNLRVWVWVLPLLQNRQTKAINAEELTSSPCSKSTYFASRYPSGRSFVGFENGIDLVDLAPYYVIIG